MKTILVTSMITMVAGVIVMGLVVGCTTTTTREDRCQIYKTGLAAAQQISDDEARKERIEFYRELIKIWCEPSG